MIKKNRFDPHPSVEYFAPPGAGHQSSLGPRGTGSLFEIGERRDVRRIVDRAKVESESAFLVIPRYFLNANTEIATSILAKLCITSTDPDRAFQEAVVSVPDDELDRDLYYSHLRCSSARPVQLPARRGFTELSGILYRYFEGEGEGKPASKVRVVSVERTSLVGGRIVYSVVPGEYHSYESRASSVADVCKQRRGNRSCETLVMQRIFVGFFAELESTDFLRHTNVL